MKITPIRICFLAIVSFGILISVLGHTPNRSSNEIQLGEFLSTKKADRGIDIPEQVDSVVFGAEATNEATSVTETAEVDESLGSASLSSHQDSLEEGRTPFDATEHRFKSSTTRYSGGALGFGSSSRRISSGVSSMRGIVSSMRGGGSFANVSSSVSAQVLLFGTVAWSDGSTKPGFTGRPSSGLRQEINFTVTIQKTDQPEMFTYESTCCGGEKDTGVSYPSLGLWVSDDGRYMGTIRRLSNGKLRYTKEDKYNNNKIVETGELEISPSGSSFLGKATAQ